MERRPATHIIISRRGPGQLACEAIVARFLLDRLPDCKTRILKGFRRGAPNKKSFFDRPLLLALLYPMNIELGN
jgi:hypothetical protein